MLHAYNCLALHCLSQLIEELRNRLHLAVEAKGNKAFYHGVKQRYSQTWNTIQSGLPHVVTPPQGQSQPPAGASSPIGGPPAAAGKPDRLARFE